MENSTEKLETQSATALQSSELSAQQSSELSALQSSELSALQSSELSAQQSSELSALQSSELSAQQSTEPSAQPTPPVAPIVDDEVDIDLFARVKLRTATIVSVEPVPKSKKLYQLQLDVGELGKRQIVSGIAQHYSPEQLVGKQIVIIANLKPAKLMGVESQGMLLAASTDADGNLALLTPDKPIASGARVR